MRRVLDLTSVTPVQTAHAWINFDASAGIRDSHNVSSITTAGAGDFTVTWAIPFASASSYAALGNTSYGGGSGTQYFFQFQSITASSVRTAIYEWSGAAAASPTYVHLAALGEY